MHVQTTSATTPDRQQLPSIHEAPAAKGLLPAEHLVDAGYPDAETLVTNRVAHGVEVIGPVMPDTAWHAHAADAFDVSCFLINRDEQRATCPPGKVSIRWSAGQTDNRGTEMINIQVAREDCQGCPARPRCITARNGRRLSVRLKEQHRAL